MDAIKTAMAEAFEMGAMYEAFKNSDKYRDEVVERLYKKHKIDEGNSSGSGLLNWTSNPCVTKLTEQDKKKLAIWIDREPEKAKEVVEIYSRLHCNKWIAVEPLGEKKFEYLEMVVPCDDSSRDLIKSLGADLDKSHLVYSFGEYDSVQTTNNTIDNNANYLNMKIINYLTKIAGTRTTWDFANCCGDTIKQKFESLYVRIVETSAVIHRKTWRGGANFIITSPEIASIFETATTGFRASDDYGDDLFVQYCGIVNSRWGLYKYTMMKPGMILIGYRGDSDMDNGVYLAIDHLHNDTEFAIGSRPNPGRFYATIDVQNFIV